MKRKVAALLLGVSLALTACQTSVTTGGDDSGVVTDTAPDSGTEDTKEEQETEEQPEVQETASSEEEEFYTGGGVPWIDSDIKANITEGMNPTAKEDFHLYVNYDWLLSNDIQEGHKTYAAYNGVEEEVRANAQALFEDENLPGHTAELVRELYGECLDWDARNELGMEPIMDTVEMIRSAGDLDAISDIISDPDGDVLLSVFLDYDVDLGLSDASTYVANVKPASFLLKDAAEYEERTMTGDLRYKAGKEETAALLVKAGFGREEAEELFDMAVDFEAQLAEAALTSADQMAADYIEKINNVMSLQEFLSLSGNYPLEGYLHAEGLDRAKQYLVWEPEYVRRLGEIYTEDNLESIKAEMLVRYMMDTADLLDREAYGLSVEKDNTVSGATGQTTDEEYAYKVLTDKLPEVVSRAYVEKYDLAGTKQDIEDICHDIIGYYRQMLEGEDWLSDETRALALEKLDNIIVKAVYPDEWHDYSGLSLDGLNYMESVRAIKKFEKARKLEKIDQKADREEWMIPNILEVNAFYNPSDNSINIILGILGGEFYGDDMTDEEKYGGIGSVIGHEISHAFDTFGAQFDKDGNMASWWTDEDYAAFQERAAKLAAYYDNIAAFSGELVTGSQIQTEAIADMTGMKCLLSIAATYDDFDYAAFFEQYAKAWKLIITPEYEYYLLRQDTHPLQYLRTNVTLQQFDEFYDTYDIQPGDTMYLAGEDRILVW